MDSEEIRVNFRSHDGILGDQWTIEGQMLSHRVFDKITVGGRFRLGHPVGEAGKTEHNSSSALGTHITYEINPYIYVTGSGAISSTRDLSGGIYVNSKISYYKNLTILPFVHVDHLALVDVGLIHYFHVGKIGFHVGVSYQPPIKDIVKHNVVFILGTSFGKDNTLFKAERERLKKSLNEPK